MNTVMASRSNRMKPVQRVAETRESRAAEYMKTCEQQLQELEQKLKLLTDYRDEYVQGCSINQGSRMDVIQLQNFRSFIARIDQAVAQQKQVVDEARGRYEQAHQAWLSSRSRSRAVDKVMDRLQKEEQRTDERLQQKANDEFAGRGGKSSGRDN